VMKARRLPSVKSFLLVLPRKKPKNKHPWTQHFCRHRSCLILQIILSLSLSLFWHFFANLFQKRINISSLLQEITLCLSCFIIVYFVHFIVITFYSSLKKILFQFFKNDYFYKLWTSFSFHCLGLRANRSTIYAIIR
jgi:hypothetical protein